MLFPALVSIGMDPSAQIAGVPGSGEVTIAPPATSLANKLAAEWFGREPTQRDIRDSLLSLTDWTQAADSPLTQEKRSAWATYRQSLRDLPQTDGAWPTPPQ